MIFEIDKKFFKKNIFNINILYLYFYIKTFNEEYL